VVTHQLQVERRTRKVRRSLTDVLPLCHATNNEVWELNWFQTANVTFKVIRGHRQLMVLFDRPHMISY